MRAGGSVQHGLRAIPVGLGRALKKRGVQAAGALEKGMFVLLAGPEPGKMN